MAKRSAVITGASGEYFVAAYLSSMGLVVALPRAGIPSTDLLVTSEKGGRAISVQVKTGASDACHATFARTPERNYWVWRTGARAIKLSHESLWYAFVFLNGWPTGDGLPEVFFVPSKTVARCVRKEYKKNDTQLFYWMYDSDAEQCRGLKGYRKLAECLRR